MTTTTNQHALYHHIFNIHKVSFLDPTKPRCATVTAASPGRLFVLNRAAFWAVCEQDAELMRRIQDVA